MNYQQIYQNLIERARTRELQGSVERHHVLPRCLGGTDETDNIVRLTPEEHYVAHQLLLKMYPTNQKLAYAAQMMASTRGNKLFGWVRRKASELAKGKDTRTPEVAKAVGKIVSAALKGKAKSPSHKAAIAQALKARGPAVKTKIAKSMIGNTSKKDGIYFKRIAASYLIPF